MNRLLSWIVALGLAAGMLAGCGGTAGESGSKQGADQTASPPAQVQAASPGASAAAGSQGSWPKTITDDAGNKIELKAKPERIAILHAMYLDYFLALDTVPAASAGVVDALRQFETLAPYKDTTGIIDLGSARELSVEAVLAAKPDVIVTFKGHVDKIYDSLVKIAPVVQLDYSGRWQDSLLLCAQLAGKEQLADKYIQETEALIVKTREQLAKQGPKTVALIRSTGKGEFTALGSGNTLYYNEASGFGLAIPPEYPKDSQQLSLDALSKMNPDFIIFRDYLETAEAAVKSNSSSAVWQALDAVKNNRVLYFDASLNTESPIATRLSAEKLLQAFSK
ncbi:MAG: ferrichrome transporter [Paenibacillaceae bacterium]|jgi:iron complex transport system substrate-binding protein|nr:ferrichrome transporter [Paenibacillaceae bacterium]